MQVCSFLFGRKPIPVANCVFSEDNSSVELTILKEISTPSGEIQFPAQTRMNFSKIQVRGDTIIPCSSGVIDAA